MFAIEPTRQFQTERLAKQPSASAATCATALSRCRTKNAKSLHLREFQAAATASRHALIATARSVRWL
jgi:hypothetical protein